jgi:hypothetical protein
MTETAPETTNGEQEPPEGEQQPESKTFDADYVANLRREAAKYRTEAKANADAAAKLAQLEEAQKTEAEKLTDRVAAAERERDAARVEALRTKVGSAQRLPAAVADLLQGSTEEELTAHAAVIAAEFDKWSKDNSRPRGDLDQGGRSRSVATSPAQEFAHLMQAQLQRPPS